MIFNKEIFWYALSAIATTGACIIALWQTTYNNRKKLKLHLSPKTYFVSNEIEMCLSIEIINVGNRKVIIKEWCYFMADKSVNKNSERIILITVFNKFMNTKLPQIICIEDSVSLHLNYTLFVNQLTELLEKNKISKTQKLIFGVKDSTGKIYKIKSKQTVNEFIELGLKNVSK